MMNRHPIMLVGAMLLAEVLVAPMVRAAPGLDSRPTGIYLRIDGPTTIAGSAPIPMEALQQGDYRLTVDCLGFAAARARLYYSAEHRLTASAPTSALAFLAPPGFALMRRGEAGRGLVLLSAGAAGGVEVARKVGDVENASDDVALATAAYDRAVSESAIVQARLARSAATAEEHDAETMRSLWLGYTAAVWVGSALEAWLLTPRPELSLTGDGQYVLAVPRAGGWQAGWRSALYPGTGQQFLGRSGPANGFAAAVFGLGAGSIAAYESYLDAARDRDDARRRYDAAETEAEVDRWARSVRDAREKMNDRNVVRWTLLGLAGAAYVWNVVDAAVAGGRAAKHDDVLAWSIVPTAGGVQTAVVWRVR
jgi:hypothetical protein